VQLSLEIVRIVYREGHWYCTEIFSTQSFGYGRYAFTLTSRSELLDKNVILGLFTWDDPVPEYNYREIDIEFSRWGEEKNDIAQFVVQPWDTPGNLHRFEVGLQDYTLHSFDWRFNGIQFSSYLAQESAPDENREIGSWLYMGALSLRRAMKMFASTCGFCLATCLLMRELSR
jgi:hypothetical protein